MGHVLQLKSKKKTLFCQNFKQNKLVCFRYFQTFQPECYISLQLNSFVKIVGRPGTGSNVTSIMRQHGSTRHKSVWLIVNFPFSLLITNSRRSPRATCVMPTTNSVSNSNLHPISELEGTFLSLPAPVPFQSVWLANQPHPLPRLKSEFGVWRSRRFDCYNGDKMGPPTPTDG